MPQHNPANISTVLTAIRYERMYDYDPCSDRATSDEHDAPRVVEAPMHGDAAQCVPDSILGCTTVPNARGNKRWVGTFVTSQQVDLL